MAVSSRILGNLISHDFPYFSVCNEFVTFQHDPENKGIRLSPYGYVMYAIDHYGYKCAYKNLMASKNVVEAYEKTALKYRDDMPAMLLNAKSYVTKIFSNIPDVSACLRQLEGMTFPYIMYVLFAGGGSADVVMQYRPEIEEQMKRYPSTLDLLPASYKKVGQEIVDADPEQF